jgi:hypothetical protein
MKDLKNFGKELADALQEEAMSMITQTIQQSRLKNPTFMSSFLPKEKWIADLINGIIDGSDAIGVAVRLGRIDRTQLQATLQKNLEIGRNAALLEVHFKDDQMAKDLKTIFWGGELQEVEADGKKLSKIVIDGTPGFNELALASANEEFLKLLKKRLQKENPRIQKLIEEFKEATKDKG